MNNNGEIPVADMDAHQRHYLLRLYIAGPTTISTRALVNIRSICEEHLHGHYELEVIDLSVEPKRAMEDNIISLPTLLKIRPRSVQRLVGDMSNTDRVLKSLDIDPTAFEP